MEPRARATLLSGLSPSDLSATLKGMASEEIHTSLPFLSHAARGAALSTLPRAAAAVAMAALPFEDQLLTVVCVDAETGAHFLKTLAPPALAQVTHSLNSVLLPVYIRHPRICSPSLQR